MTSTASIRTPWNIRHVRGNAETRRVLVNGKWQKQDATAASVLRWLKGAR